MRKDAYFVVRRPAFLIESALGAARIANTSRTGSTRPQGTWRYHKDRLADKPVFSYPRVGPAAPSPEGPEMPLWRMFGWQVPERREGRGCSWLRFATNPKREDWALHTMNGQSAAAPSHCPSFEIECTYANEFSTIFRPLHCGFVRCAHIGCRAAECSLDRRR
jgi:hypothetical protein